MSRRRSKYGGLTHLRAGSAYHLLSNKEKQAEAMSRAREPAVTCPACDMQLMVDDLLKHMDERCTGLREPSGAAKWVTWAQALELGVAAGTLHYWVHTGRVRWHGQRVDRKYSLRDIVLILAVRRLRQRREFESSKSEETKMEGTK